MFQNILNNITPVFNLQHIHLGVPSIELCRISNPYSYFSIKQINWSIENSLIEVYMEEIKLGFKIIPQ